MIMRAMCLSVLLLASVPALADDLNFILVNDTNSPLTDFYASPSGVAGWERDILSIDVLNPGENVKVTIGHGRKTCIFDLLSTFTNGSRLENRKVNLCELDRYTIRAASTDEKSSSAEKVSPDDKRQ